MTYEILDNHDVLNSYYDINEYTINLKEVNEQYIVFDFKLKHNIKRAAVVHLNYKLKNGGWLKDEFDAMENYPKDFSDYYIKSFLDQANHPDAQYEEWYK